MERMNPPGRACVDWLPFWFGCFAGAGPWAVVLMYFLGGGDFDQVPGFVYGVLVAYIIFFNTFPVNMYLQYVLFAYVYTQPVGPRRPMQAYGKSAKTASAP
jgi:hypothetical protein